MDWIKKFDIRLEKEMYYPGECLSGYVILHTIENFKLKGKPKLFALPVHPTNVVAFFFLARQQSELSCAGRRKQSGRSSLAAKEEMSRTNKSSLMTEQSSGAKVTPSPPL